MSVRSSNPSAPTIDLDNPWPGLSAFDEASERFFNGRAEEAAALRRLIGAAPLTVLFGASGLGKTSLLHAGLFPLLRRDHFLPIYIRLDLQPGKSQIQPLVEQVQSALAAEVSRHQIDAPPAAPQGTLWEYLHGANVEFWSRDNYPLTPVFVFDQFEEIFTVGAAHPGAVSRFREDLADLVENRMPATLATRVAESDSALAPLALNSLRYKVLFSFREDFLPAFEGLKRQIPSIRFNRLRLMPMSARQAFDAVHLTAPHLANPDIATRIVDFVAGRDLTWKAEGIALDETNEQPVEPALLSLVCAGLNERRKQEQLKAFDVKLLEGTGDAIIDDYYRSVTASVPRNVATFIQDELVTERGYRKQFDVDDAISKRGVTRAQLQQLVDRRFLRIEPVRNGERVELTHDLLAPVVREYRDKARQVRQRRQQYRRYALALLLAGVAVAATLAAVRYKGLSDEASENARQLKASLDKLERTSQALKDQTGQANLAKDEATRAKDQALKEKSRADLARMTAEDAATAAKVARDDAKMKAVDLERARATTQTALDNETTLKLQTEGLLKDTQAARATAEEATRTAQFNERNASVSRREADRLRLVTISQQLAAKSHASKDLAEAAQLGIYAFATYVRNACPAADFGSTVQCDPNRDDPAVLAALQDTFNRATYMGGAFAAGGVVSTAGGGITLRMTPAGAGKLAPSLISARAGEDTFEIQVARSWKDVGAGTARAPQRLGLPVDRRATAVAISPSGGELAIGRVDGSLAEWAMNGRPAAWPAQSPFASSVAALAYVDEDSILGIGGDGAMRLLQRSGPNLFAPLGSLRIPHEFVVPREFQRTLVVDGPDILVGWSRLVFGWNFKPQTNLLFMASTGGVSALAASVDHRYIAIGMRDGSVRFGERRANVLGDLTIFDARHTGAVSALAFSPDGRWLASAGRDGAVHVYPLAPGTGTQPVVFQEHDGPVDAVAFGVDGLLYSSGSDRSVRVWFTSTQQVARAVCDQVNKWKWTRLSTTTRNTLISLLNLAVPGDGCEDIDANGGVRGTGRR